MQVLNCIFSDSFTYAKQALNAIKIILYLMSIIKIEQHV